MILQEKIRIICLHISMILVVTPLMIIVKYIFLLMIHRKRGNLIYGTYFANFFPTPVARDPQLLEI